MSATTTRVSEDVPTCYRYETCGQKLQVLGPGRNVCDRCRVHGPPAPKIEAAPTQRGGDQVVGELPVCTGCGRSTLDNG